MNPRKKMMMCFLVSSIIFLSVFLSGCNGNVWEVTTLTWYQTNEEATEVKVDGKIWTIRPGDTFEGYIYWDTVDHGTMYEEYRYVSGPDTPLFYLKIWSCLLENLDRTSTYYALAVAKNKLDGSVYVAGNRLEFVPGTPIVSTEDLTDGCNYDTSSGVLIGKLRHLGGASSCQVWFEYGESETSLDKESPKQIMSSTGNFTYEITGLDSCKSYYFRAVALNDIKEDKGFVESFIPGAPIVVSYFPEDTGSTYAVLKGNLKCLGGTSSCDVWFEYGRSESNLDTKTPVQTVDSSGDITVRVDGLEPSAIYYFRLSADNGVCTGASSTLRFETEQP